MDKKTIKIINIFLKQINNKNYIVKKAYLFGSFARNNQNIDSDIDVAVVFEKPIDFDKIDLQIDLLLLASEIDSRIEPHPFSNSEFTENTPFVNEIKKTGIELKVN